MLAKKQKTNSIAPIEVKIPRFWAWIVTESGTIIPKNAKSFCSKLIMEFGI
jgi:hypothetical protein